MHKTKTLLSKLKLARQFEADPLGVAKSFSLNGINAMINAGKPHPWTGLLLWIAAWGDDDIQRSFTEALMAMDKMAEGIERKGTPAEFEAKLRDPSRSEQGYSLDAFLKRGTSRDIEHFRPIVQAKLNPGPKVVVPKRKPLDTVDAYILPDGKLVHVGYWGHTSYAGDRKPDELGWIKIGSGAVYLTDVEPNARQLRKLKEWCAYHHKDYGVIEEHLRDEPYRAYHFFTRPLVMKTTVDGG